jgi:hypothetical protein
VREFGLTPLTGCPADKRRLFEPDRAIAISVFVTHPLSLALLLVSVALLVVVPNIRAKREEAFQE